MARILHLDDEPSVGLIVADALTRAGHSPIGVDTVPEALQVFFQVVSGSNMNEIWPAVPVEVAHRSSIELGL
jgi:hypothetical protein